MQSAAPTSPPSPPVGGRLVAIDALRGLVILLLVPDVYGGFSVHEMARREPDSALWAALAGQLTHVPWSGATLWDLIMPMFVFLIGVSMALSIERRLDADETPRHMLAHAGLRSGSLIVLGMSLLVQPTTLFELALPYIVLATGLPWSGVPDRRAGASRGRFALWLDLLLPAAVVAAVGLWLALHLRALGDYDFDEILVQLGLAYLPAFLLAGRGLRAPAARALLILVAWGAAFLLYTPPPGALPVGETFQGLLGHWNNGTNLAATFDRWFLNLLPRSAPYLGNPHGYHTLQFVPLVAQMLAGVVVGRLLRQGLPHRALLTRLFAAGGLGLLVSGLLSVTVAPLVKSLWTPSWAIFSTALCVLALALVMGVFRSPTRSWLLRSLSVLGSNAMLLYVISVHDRWRLTLLWQTLFGPTLTANALRPVLESLLVLVTLWAFAYALDRSRVRLRL
jgi:heparan-alpha-glucosaminide N-acetyltransferase